MISVGQPPPLNVFVAGDDVRHVGDNLFNRCTVFFLEEMEGRFGLKGNSRHNA